MKTLFLLFAIFTSANASASYKALELYTILKEAGLPDEGAAGHVYQEKVFGVTCSKNVRGVAYSCALDRDDSEGKPIQIEGENAKKMWALFAAGNASCNKNGCFLFIDVVQCGYAAETGYDPGNVPSLKERTSCDITSTHKL